MNKKESLKTFDAKICKFFIRKKRTFSFFLLFIFFATFFVYEKISATKKSRMEDILYAEIAYKNWKKDLKNTQNLNKLKEFFKKTTFLYSRYRGKIIQDLIFIKDEQAQKLAEGYLKDIGDHKPFFSDFVDISFLIFNDRLKEAFQESEKLKIKLEKLDKANLSIYSYNLLRMSFLAKNLNDKVKEQQTWKILEKHIEKKEGKMFLKNLQENYHFNLIEYVSFRKKKLS